MNGSVTIDKILFIVGVLMCSCTELIEYSPYDTPVKTLDFNRTEAEKITNMEPQFWIGVSLFQMKI